VSKSAKSQALVDRLNELMPKLGYGATWTLGHGGWVHEYHPRTGYLFHHRASALPERVAKRERQLARRQLEIGGQT
jgi:hypothetical protein